MFINLSVKAGHSVILLTKGSLFLVFLKKLRELNILMELILNPTVECDLVLKQKSRSHSRLGNTSVYQG